MIDLIFLTDRYPYNNSEAFIENEIDIMSRNFDRVFILPCGLMVNTSYSRDVPNNVFVLTPPCSGDIFQNKPNRTQKAIWAVRHLLPWVIACFFSRPFYTEVYYLMTHVGFTLARMVKVFRTLAPSLRNYYYYRRHLAKYNVKEAFIYSYWIEPTILFSDSILPKTKIYKKICRTHRWDLYIEETNIKYLAYQKQVIADIDALYVISEDGLDYLKRVYPQFESKFMLSRLGTKDYGINPPKIFDNDFIIASCSFVNSGKRVNLIVESLAMVNTAGVHVKWIHMGGGPDLNYTEDLAKEKLSGKIEYRFTGQVLNKEIIEFYKNNHVDLFINVSSSEGIPVSIMEAASFSIPIVATNVGGTREIVIDDYDGLLIPKNFSPACLAGIIEDLAKEESPVERYRKGARLIWEERFSREVNYKEFYKLLFEE